MIRPVSIALAIGLLAACGHMPWRAKPAPVPQAVNELMEVAADGTATSAFPQYWKRNTLVIDMQGAASMGEFALRPRTGGEWPMRLAFRVRPGTLGLIEVRADQRMLIPVTREGSKPVDIELVPGVYTPKSEQLSVKWGQ